MVLALYAEAPAASGGEIGVN